MNGFEGGGSGGLVGASEVISHMGIAVEAMDKLSVGMMGMLGEWSLMAVKMGPINPCPKANRPAFHIIPGLFSHSDLAFHHYVQPIRSHLATGQGSSGNNRDRRD